MSLLLLQKPEGLYVMEYYVVELKADLSSWSLLLWMDTAKEFLNSPVESNESIKFDDFDNFFDVGFFIWTIQMILQTISLGSFVLRVGRDSWPEQEYHRSASPVRKYTVQEQ